MSPVVPLWGLVRTREGMTPCRMYASFMLGPQVWHVVGS